jgi:hypothetical protein
LKPESLSKQDSLKLKDLEIVAYHHSDEAYIINECLERIKEQYGDKFQNLVKLALDYN